MSGTSLSTDAPPNNPPDADIADDAAALNGLGPISINTGSTGIILLTTSILMAIEALTDTPDQTEMEEGGNHRSQRKRPGNLMGLASTRTSTG